MKQEKLEVLERDEAFCEAREMRCEMPSLIVEAVSSPGFLVAVKLFLTMVLKDSLEYIWSHVKKKTGLFQK